MQKHNSSEDSVAPNKSPSSSSERPPSSDDHDATQTTLNPANNQQGSEEGGEQTVLKTPSQVLEELYGDDDDNGGNDGESQGGAPVAVTVAVGGGGATVVEGGVVNEGVQGRKRKASSKLRDPPIGRPTCPVCHREFSTWKGAFGHMRKHPDREYRGFFKPPVFGFTSSSTQHDQPSIHNQGDTAENSTVREEKNEERGLASSPVRGLVLDLNQPIAEAGSSHDGESAEERSAGEGQNLGFDLNQMPPAEDDDEA